MPTSTASAGLAETERKGSMTTVAVFASRLAQPPAADHARRRLGLFAIGLAVLALVGSSASLEQRAARAPAPFASLTALPSSAQAGISRVLGGDDPRYLARRSPDGFRFQNPQQGVRARFASSGLRLR